MGLEDLPRYLRDEYQAGRQRRWMRFWWALSMFWAIMLGWCLDAHAPVLVLVGECLVLCSTVMLARWNT